MGSAFELVELKGGRMSIRSLIHGETMHIGTDPRTESLALHVGQQRLAERVSAWRSDSPFVIWDIGLGPAGNAITAIEVLREAGKQVEIHSFEIDTAVLEFALGHAGALGYLVGWEDCIRELLAKGVVSPVPGITWHLHRGDFSTLPFKTPSPASIFFDPYSPARNPEMWSQDVFRKLWDVAGAPDAPDCMMTNYTRSTSVRVTMALAGWFVGVGVPTGDKEETTVAANRICLLENPLDSQWLSRVRASTNSSPLRGRHYVRGPIEPGDYKELMAHPQFCG